MALQIIKISTCIYLKIEQDDACSGCQHIYSTKRGYLNELNRRRLDRHTCKHLWRNEHENRTIQKRDYYFKLNSKKKFSDYITGIDIKYVSNHKRKKKVSIDQPSLLQIHEFYTSGDHSLIFI